MPELARLISRIFAPLAVGAALLLTLPWRYPQTPWWASVTAASFLMLMPWLALEIMRRRGVVSDIHVTRREQRKPVFVAALVSIVIGIAVLLIAHAPWVVLLESLSILAGLVVVAVLSLRWKVSVHATMAAYAACRLAPFIPVVGIPLAVAFVVLIAWSRLKPDEHTVDQVLLGTTLGASLSLLPVLLA